METERENLKLRGEVPEVARFGSLRKRMADELEDEEPRNELVLITAAGERESDF